ncbi:hypothetical protein Barb4_05565 [Bacteroidales bacterium Barb4]|nr:hypothetical protein Barb4_05565 [Bacteroidales bacterium Barb4]
MEICRRKKIPVKRGGIVRLNEVENGNAVEDAIEYCLKAFFIDIIEMEVELSDLIADISDRNSPNLNENRQGEPLQVKRN